MNKTSIIDTAVLKEKVQEYAMKVGCISARWMNCSISGSRNTPVI